MSVIEKILKQCDGVDVKSVRSKDWQGKVQYTDILYKISDVKLPETDIFIEITATATKGTIGKVVDIEVETYKERYPDGINSEPTKFVMYDNTIIYEVEGRKQKGRIKSQYTKLLIGNHKTKYVRDVETHKQVEIKNPVNKYKQEMQLGDWAIGVAPGKILKVGRITRWTNHNLWGTLDEEGTKNPREFKFDSIAQTITMPDSDQVQQLLTLAILKGAEI